MHQTGKFVGFIVVGAATIISTIGILGFTAIQFSNSSNHLQLDVDVQPSNLRMRAAVGVKSDSTTKESK